MAHYTRMDNQQRKLDFRDTFLELDPPYELTFPPAKPANDDEAVTIGAKSYSAPNRGMTHPIYGVIIMTHHYS